MIHSHSALSYLGQQIPIGATRRCLPYDCGLAPSYVPTRLFFECKPPVLKVALQSIQLQKKVEQLVVKPPINPQLIVELKEDLKNHVEGRIQLFLQQMLFIYKRQLSLEVYKRADLQIGQIPSKGVQEPPYVAAHSSTLPILRLAQSESGDTFTSLAHNTSFYYAWNTTVYLPLLANQIDSVIDGSLRDPATAILNQVSLGKCSPEKGLSVFLTLLLRNIESQKKSSYCPEQEILLSTYSQVVDNYLTNATNGYPLLQKLCLRPIEEQIDDSFYRTVQAAIDNQFKAESSSPETVILPRLEEGIDVKQIQEMIARKKLAFPNSVRAREYIKYCTTVDKVRGCAMAYLNHLHNQPPERREEELNYILQSHAARSLYENTRKAIKEAYPISEPKNMNLILPGILYECSQALAPPPSSTPASGLENQLKMEISSRITETRSATALKHAKICSSAVKVQAAAQAFFNQLLATGPSTRKTELDKLFTVTRSNKGLANLSKEAFTFCETIWEAIENSPKGVKNPRNLPYILLKVLSDLPNHSPPQIEEGKM